ncbi:MAG TPA: GGDEF domain-containing protein, partial [Actinomycetales bacterium]
MMSKRGVGAAADPPSGAADLYAGADLRRAHLFSAACWGFGALGIGLLSLLHPPTVASAHGWWLLGAMLVALTGFAVASALGRPSFTQILVQQHVAALGAAALQWTAGGWASPIDRELLLLMVFAAFVHPLRRCLPLWLLCGTLMLLPASYGPVDGLAVPRLFDLLTTFGTCVFASSLIATVRAQRVELSKGRESAQADARRDHLTGLPNRRAFVEALDRSLTTVLQQPEASGRVAVGLGDVDGFKQVNDTFGHLEGDACLTDIARALNAAAGPHERVFRWGGDEFAVLVVGGDPAETASRLEAAVRIAVSTPDGRPVSVTLGFRPDDGAGAAALVAGADEALMARKSERRRAPRRAADRPAAPVAPEPSV